MIPDELKQRFAVRTTGAVRRGEYMFAFGFPCQVQGLQYVRDAWPTPACDGENSVDYAPRGTLNVMCRDIFTGAPHCVQTRAPQFITFQPERRDHKVLMVDDQGVLTDTDDERFSLQRLPVQLWDVISTLEAPACLVHNGERVWAANRAIEKITPGEPVSEEQLMAELLALEA
jgi:hypothetical protein